MINVKFYFHLSASAVTMGYALQTLGVLILAYMATLAWGDTLALKVTDLLSPVIKVLRDTTLFRKNCSFGQQCGIMHCSESFTHKSFALIYVSNLKEI